MAGLDPLAELHLERCNASREWRQDFRKARRIGFDHGGENKLMLDFLFSHLRDGQLAAQRRVFRNRDPLATTDEVGHVLMGWLVRVRRLVRLRVLMRRRWFPLRASRAW